MLDKEPYNRKNKELIRKFLNYLQIKENISEIGRINYAQRLRVVARWMPDKFVNPDSEAMDRVLDKLANSDYSDWTEETYLNMIKKFYKWSLGNNKSYPEFLDCIKRPRNNNNVKPEELITPDELSALIKASANVRDRALFSVPYNSGCRIGEILTMKIKDLGFDEYGAIMRVNGKTGYRQVRIVGNSIEYLKAWLDNRPDRSNPEAWLFCGLDNKNMGRQLLYSDVYAIVRRAVKRSGIKRRIYPHLFRHTRATILASKVTEAPLEAKMGWVHGSRQTKTYVHLSMRDQDSAILRAYGIKVDEDKTIREERPKECPRCHQLNPSDAKYCRNCWMPFDISTALEIEEKERNITKALIQSEVLDSLLAEVLKSVPENSRLQVLVTILEKVVKDPEKKEKLLEELSNLLRKGKD